jgi:hypothetical protein
VTYRHCNAERERLLAAEPALDESGCVLSVTVPKPNCGYGEHSIRGATLTVTLRRDFILDARGTPVDGTHLRGALPSGNGTAGGDFVSWFTVVDPSDQEASE